MNYFSPKVNLEVLWCLNVYLWSRDMSSDQTFEMKQIGELMANVLFLDKQISISN